MTGGPPRRTIVFVGATSGIGRQAARRLAADGHRLVLVGRDPRRSEHLRSELPNATVVTADIATASGVSRVVCAITASVDHVDTLVNNAGVMLPDRRVTTEGVELNLAVHHLAPHRLTRELLPLLRRGDGRVVNVNSEGHRVALFNTAPIEIDFTDLNGERGYDPFVAYSRSKLANLLDTYEFHRRYAELTIVVHPGMVRTDLGRNFPRVRVAAMHAISISARKGAEPVVHLATAANIQGGTYYNRFTPLRSSGASYNEASADRLWRQAEQPPTAPIAD